MTIKTNEKENYIYDKITSYENLYNVIYALESFAVEINMLNDDDRQMLENLKDKFNFKYIEVVIEKCKEKLESILEHDETFKCKVYHRVKKVDGDNIVFRNLHVADLITQICMIAILNVLVFSTDDNIKEVTALGQDIPSNFYGNVLSNKMEEFYKPWGEMYGKYTDDYIEKYEQCLNEKTYKYDINLDIKNFFPTINPELIIRIISSIIAVKYDKKTLGKIEKYMEKLLFVEIENEIDKEKYYQDNHNENRKRKKCTIGLPQGLPYSYFCANIIMARISKIIAQEFDGESFFYVDDSVVFSNNVNSQEDFINKINTINKKIKKQFDNYLNQYSYKTQYAKSVMEDADNSYEIQLHNGDKSFYSEISNNELSSIKIKSLAKWSSQVKLDIFNNINEDEDEMLFSKMKAILEAIDAECVTVNEKLKIEKSKNEIQNLKLYKKRLIRYKKFYAYRVLKIGLNCGEEITPCSIADFDELLFGKVAEKDIVEKCKTFLRTYDEDLFFAKLGLFSANAKISNDDLENTNEKNGNITKAYGCLINHILFFEKELLGECYCESGYFKVYLDNTSIIKNIDNNSYEISYCNLDQCDKNYSINKLVKKYFNNNSYFNQEEREKQIKRFECFSIEKSKKLCEDILRVSVNKCKYDEVLRISDKYISCILKEYFCKIFNIDNNGNIAISRNGRIVTFNEYRILTYLDNSNFILKDFLSFLNEKIIDSDYKFSQQILDADIMKLTPIVKKYVGNAKKIDDLLVVHKYVNDLWMNGSKHLHFYTLHNQQHALELISKSIDIVKCIDYFNLKNEDYYILFLACYLHDIAMLQNPKKIDFLNDMFEGDRILTSFKDTIENILQDNKIADLQELKSQIVDMYREVDAFYENKLRNEHATNSAVKIIKDRNLKFINNSDLEHIAEVSKAHGQNVEEVYGLKSFANSSNLSLKYLKILLRIADNLDVSKDRVNRNLLNDNLEFMEKSSQFHWISHSIINNCIIKSEYTFDKVKFREDNVNINQYSAFKYIKSKLCVNFNLNYFNNNGLDWENDSKDCPMYRIKPNGKKNGEVFRIAFKNKLDKKDRKIKEQKCNNCCLSCYWMKKKNQYLIEEIIELFEYLNNNKLNDTNMNGEIEISYSVLYKEKLSNKQLDVVREYLKGG